MGSKNYHLFTIPDILEEIDEEYFEFISGKSSNLPFQKTIYGNNQTKKSGQIRDLLVDGRAFRERFESLSTEGKKFFMALYSSGRVFFWRDTPEKKEGLELKKEVYECVDKLMVFAIPSRTNPDIFIIPLEYAMVSDLPSGKENDISLAHMLKEYPRNVLSKIAHHHGIPTKGSSIIISAGIYSSVLENLHESLEKLSAEERKIMDYMVENDGVINLWDLLEHFNMIGHSSYYWRIDLKNILSHSSYFHGDSFISLLEKGLVYCARGRYYSEAEFALLPDEIIMDIRNRRKQNRTLIQEMKKPENKISVHNLENYAYDLSAQIKKIGVVLYYLERRSKRTTEKVIKQILSMPENDYYSAINLAKYEGWIKQNKSSLSITPEGMGYLEDKNFPSMLRVHVLEHHVFSYRKHANTEEIPYLDLLRKLFLQSIYDLKGPEMLDGILGVIKSGDIFFELVRELKISMLNNDDSRGYMGPSQTLEENMDSAVTEWFFELIEFLKIFGLIRLSSSEIGPETVIFPSQEFKEAYENPNVILKNSITKSQKKPLKILPNNEILIEISADFKDLKTIADFADIVSVDTVCTFAVTKASLSGYLNRLGKLANVTSFLKQKSSVAVPNTVERLISDMGRRKDEIGITKCQAVLQVNDRTIIDGIMRIKSVSDLIEKRISPEILIIKEDVSLYRFVTEIRKKGYIVPISVEKEKYRRRTERSPWKY